MQCPAKMDFFPFFAHYALFTYLGECRCQDGLIEYINPEGHHCYPKNSRGPCQEGQILIQPDETNKNGEIENPVCTLGELGLRSSIFNSKNGFENECENGKQFDVTTQKCVETFTHTNNSISKRRMDVSIGRHTDILKFLIWKMRQ